MTHGLVLPPARNAYGEQMHKAIHTIVTMLCPGVVTPQQFASCAVVAANELKEGDCEPKSVLLAAAHAAQMGLIPGKAQRLAFFIPRKLKSRKLCQLTVSYQGYITLATRNRFLRWVHADIVLQGEEFFVGVKESLPVVEHNIPPNRSLQSGEVRSRLVGAYCLYETVSGGRAHVYMPKQEIDAIGSKGGMLWKGDQYPAMVRKTPVRRAANFWNLSPEMSLAVRLDEQLDLGEAQDVGTTLDVESESAGDVDLDAMEE